MPFGAKCEYADMQECIAANQDKDDPGAYCATLMRETEGHCKMKAESGRVVTKLIRAETHVIDAGAGEVEAVVSTEVRDRTGDIIRQEHWDLKSFKRHPVLLSSHDYLSLRSQIGEWKDMKVDGKKLVGVAKYYIDEGNAEADWGFKLAQKGRAAFSVGFIPDMAKAERLAPEKGSDEDSMFGSGWEFKGQELLEVSHVVVPANPQALQKLAGVKLDPSIAGIIEELLAEQGAARHPMTIDALAEAVAERVWIKMASQSVYQRELDGGNQIRDLTEAIRRSL